MFRFWSGTIRRHGCKSCEFGLVRLELQCGKPNDGHIRRRGGLGGRGRRGGAQGGGIGQRRPDCQGVQKWPGLLLYHQVRSRPREPLLDKPRREWPLGRRPWLRQVGRGEWTCFYGATLCLTLGIIIGIVIIASSCCYGSNFHYCPA